MLDLDVLQPRILGNDCCPKGSTEHKQKGTDTRTDRGDEKGESELYNTKDESEGSATRADKDQASSCPGHPVIVRVVFEGRGRNDVHSLLPEFGGNITDHTTKGLHRISKSGSIANPPTILLVATSIVHAEAVVLPETLESPHQVFRTSVVHAACTGVRATLETVSIGSDVDLSHVYGLDQSTRADLTNVGENEEDDRDDREDGRACYTMFASHGGRMSVLVGST